MKKFLHRNSPVFVIGFVVFLVFVGIISKSKSRVTKETSLIGVEDNEVDFDYDYEEIEEEEPRASLESLIQQVKESTESSESVWYPGINSAMHGDVLFIRYTEENGFLPRNSVGTIGKYAMWRNETDRQIRIKQLTEKCEEFKVPVTINPGDYFAFMTTEKGMWTYHEVETEDFGSIFVEEPKR